MKYSNIIQGNFIKRPNRFIAHVEIDGKEEICHVKNTGRCKELLIKGCTVYLEKSNNTNRKTKYDLIAVEKGNLLINMDSNAPNKVVQEWLKSLECPIVQEHKESFVKPEYKYKNSRFDFYVEDGTRKILIEVKGVTLENHGVVKFPDAPSERAVKHVEELIDALQEGYESYVIFVVQMKGAKYFKPNEDTQPEFCKVLKKAQKAGVQILAYDCIVTEDTLRLDKQVKVCL